RRVMQASRRATLPALAVDPLCNLVNADDLAATLAVKVTQAGHQATIVSTDKGYCQLLSPTLRIRDYFQKRWLDAPFIDKEFGVQPQQLPDYWGLAGISSSKVPGVAGIGPKSATQLLVEFQSLEGMSLEEARNAAVE
ncbi:5'-3' exonuclease H3TH domain-containing protein, partial [Escherichia coli]